MHYAMEVMKGLPADTKIFCGHEYTKANLKFCATVLPEDVDIQEKIEESNYLLDNMGFSTVPSILRDEVKYNVFMRYDDKAIQELVGTEDPI